ncbi:sulfate permease [Sodiomyces alkalinus F11]|uniref:Sulfate permease n=1 Tax=Sodiomyces alkalinus (strain CBS 110278 / VKM F-3762 / F11) TaxID=1314773 RepID=A0A3N2Q0E5_SODAK|nr:sulfate permease [Sodiomyces alkalinus F11]ROT40085.1 sulfate permease [Sodiomyces alkalinus F11]
MGSRAGNALAKVLGIKLPEPGETEELLREESVLSTGSFAEEPPTSAEWLRELVPDRTACVNYVTSLFPFVNWVGYYNLKWFTGDLVAGITVGAVVVPQGMAYAILANLASEFGLYSSFMGVIIYCSDAPLRPVAVLSTVVGNIVARTRDQFPQYEPHHIASAVAIVSGSIVLFIGLVRLGWMIDIIPLTSLPAFMTGSAITIPVGQIPSMMGMTEFPTREAPYLVIINIPKHLGDSKIDAAMGLTALSLLYVIRAACSYAARRWPARQWTFFFLSTLRTAFVIMLYTMISWLVNRTRRGDPLFKILGEVPRGFQDAGVPKIDTTLIRSFASDLPATVIVLVIKHIPISKSFGRVNNYTIDPSQEFVAIGVTNVLAPFLGGYPSTVSFSRTAIKSKAGVRTPFAGVITCIVVLLAIHALTSVFFYIPNASLSAVIIHTVGDLITPPDTVYRFWLVSPLEVFMFFLGVLVTVFSSIKDDIYATRILRGRGRFLGKVKIHSVIGDHIIGEDHREILGKYGTFDADARKTAARNVFLPIDHGDGSNPQVEVDNPYPGIFIYRFLEGFNYPNAAHSLEYLCEYIFKRTHRTDMETHEKLGDPSKAAAERHAAEGRPTLKAVTLDFSSVNNIDITSVQRLIDVRNQLDRYAAPDVVDWHFACINNRWTKRALAAAGFGYRTVHETNADQRHPPRRRKSIFSVAEIGGSDSAAAMAEKEEGRIDRITDAIFDDGRGGVSAAGGRDAYGEQMEAIVQRKGVAVAGVNRPLFHVDLTNALQSAIANVEAREGEDMEEGKMPSP